MLIFMHFQVRQRREMRKEKAFQAILLTQIKDAEKFSAEQYVAEKIRSATGILSFYHCLLFKIIDSC